MEKFSCTLSWMLLISSVCLGQTQKAQLEKTQTAKQITIKKDTVSKGKVVTRSIYKFEEDTLYIKEMDKKMKWLDSVNNTKKKKLK